MKYHSRKFLAAILAVTMAVPAAVSTAAPLYASAGEILEETAFEHKMIPWRLAESSPAKQDFRIEDGAVHVTIQVPEGYQKSKWDLQFRNRGLTFRAGHTYQISCDIKSNREGMEICSEIGHMSGELVWCSMRDGEFIQGPHIQQDLRGYDDYIVAENPEGWGNAAKLTTEYQTFYGEWTPTKDYQNAEWRFEYANDSNGYGGNAQRGDEIWFKNMSIRDTVSDCCDPQPKKTYGLTGRSCYFGYGYNEFISVNQLGYYPGLAKYATLGDDQGDLTFYEEDHAITLEGSYDFELVNAKDDTVVYTGKTSEAAPDPDSGDKVCRIDFSAYNQTGEYYLRIKGEKWRSMPFRIGSDIYQEEGHDLLTNAINYFYQNRAGSDIEKDYITSGENKNLLSHAKDFRTMVYDDTGYVQPDWKKEWFFVTKKDVKESSSSEIDISGGWYTGFDYQKSMTDGGFAVWMLQNMYERAAKDDAGKQKFADGSGTAVVPETDNAVPDILDECRYELDFMSRMKVQSDEPTWGEYAGLYYDNALGFGMVSRNALNTGFRSYGEYDDDVIFSVQPPTFAATLYYAGCAAQAARLWAPYDAAYAAELWNGAKEAYQAYTEHWYEPGDERNNPTSQYYSLNRYDVTDEVRDEAYWAACELYISANEMDDPAADTYLKALSAYDHAFEVTPQISSDDSFYHSYDAYNAFTPDNMAAAGSLALLQHQDLLDETQLAKLQESLIRTADNYLENEQKQGYGTPFRNDFPIYENFGPEIRVSGYEYGSNYRALFDMVTAAIAYDLTGNAKYLSCVTCGMDYLLGNNPMSFSFITGYGDYCVKNPCNRVWRHELEYELPKAPDGVIVSGPNAHFYYDGYMRALGFVNGDEDNYSQRCYADSVESLATNDSILSGNAALAWVVSFIQDEAPDAYAESDVPGDANGNGAADVADAVAMVKYLGGTGTLRAPEAADLNKDHTVNAVDLTLLKRILLK